MPHLSLSFLALAFLAGFVSVLVFHQGAWAALHAGGVVPTPAWSVDPIPPFGVPKVVSQAFWGGLWGIALALILANAKGGAYWGGWIILGAVLLTLVALFVVPVVKGQPIAASLPRFGIGAFVNGMWGLGTALFLKVIGAANS